MVASAFGGTERVGCGHIMLVAVIEAPTVGAMEMVGGGHITPLTSVSGVMWGKVDTAETGIGGDFERSTVAPRDKIDLPLPSTTVDHSVASCLTRSAEKLH